MKKIILIFTAAIISSASFGQSTLKEDVDIIQSVYGKEKKELIGSYMKLSGTEADAFWKIYDEYEAERKALGQKKVQLINDYANNFTTLTNEKADELAKASFQNNLAYEKLFQKYYNKTKPVIGALNAAKFMQLEMYLQTAIRSEIQNAIPFVGELERSVPHKH